MCDSGAQKGHMYGEIRRWSLLRGQREYLENVLQPVGRTLKVRSREQEIRLMRGGGEGGVCVCITNSPGRGQLHYVSLN